MLSDTQRWVLSFVVAVVTHGCVYVYARQRCVFVVVQHDSVCAAPVFFSILMFWMIQHLEGLLAAPVPTSKPLLGLAACICVACVYHQE